MNQIYMLCNISRQAHQQSIKRMLDQAEKEVIYIRLMCQTREIHPGMGLRTIYDMVKPDGIGRDAFISLGLREGFRIKVIDNKIRTTKSIKTHRYRNLLVERKFTDVNHLWTSDITYLLILGVVYYLVLIMDVYSRRIIGYNLSNNMKAENNYNALKMAINFRGINDYQNQLIHHSDKGSQYASDLYTETLESYRIRISMCDDVYENTHIERVHETIKNQYLERMNINNERQLYKAMDEIIYKYNYLRPHQSLNKMTPAEFEEYIKNISLNDRKKIKIYTTNKPQNQVDPNQLIINFS
jgi:putative transposase